MCGGGLDKQIVVTGSPQESRGIDPAWLTQVQEREGLGRLSEAVVGGGVGEAQTKKREGGIPGEEHSSG